MADATTWAKRVREWKDSGQTAAEFCESRELNSGTLLWWSSKLKRAGAATTARATEVMPLARLVRRAHDDLAPPTRAASTVGVEIQLGGAKVVVLPGADRATLGMVLEVLGDGARRGAR